MCDNFSGADIFNFLFTLYTWVFCLSVFLCTTYVWWLQRSEEDVGSLGLSLYSFFICSVQSFNMLGWPQSIYVPRHYLILASTSEMSFTILNHNLYSEMSKFIENNIMALLVMVMPKLWPASHIYPTHLPASLTTWVWHPRSILWNKRTYNKLSSDHTWTCICVYTPHTHIHRQHVHVHTHKGN